MLPSPKLSSSTFQTLPSNGARMVEQPLSKGASTSSSSATKAVGEKMNPYDLQPTHGQTMSNRQFNKFKAEVKANGITEPIKYVENNGTNHVVDGHHRLKAAKVLELKSVPTEKVKLPYGSYKTEQDLIYQH
ncbi:ParB N-terminal domain-containing protein [Hymenobacter sp. BT664]|uniref:ParB N-terminal domain-containing protein n=1 Tax=Hymenobacter montanus TaxID=2771359 RepID=A0A927GJW2_9BACT|nr:ParB N-terminal domain-containing protein [Hymenobacter montanus]